MRRAKVGAYCPSPTPTLVVLVVLLVGSVQFVQCHNVDDYNEFDNPELLPLFTQLGYGQISNMTTMLSAEFQKRSNFCVKDPDADWNQAFNLSFNLDFFASCIQKTKDEEDDSLFPTHYWKSATPPGTALMMLDANKMVATASSRNPTLASAMTRLQKCAFSGSWEV
ncbi:ABC transporter G family member 24 [Vitis vinifera]|uniref:ABC transporter G family member 24 n=1 Tax=Vitis vinifera TaxID=29760 RepID=A0A438FSG1_VITVI|nr:ABC transporter G family member 24 [Vitis vinifera]